MANIKKEKDFGTRVEALLKSVKYKRLSSLFDGFISGLILGMVIAVLMVGEAIEKPFPIDLVTFLVIAVMVSVAMLVWGVHSALATKD